MRSPVASEAGSTVVRRRWVLVALVGAAFLLRLAFSLTTDFWIQDQQQIYLIGLRYYATGEWPYFGPDVVYTKTQIPGGLQGLLVGGPLWIVAQPEAPYVLLNILSFGALSLLAWYIGRRCPHVPRWILWAWMFTAPWTLDFSTEINNPSYVLTGAVLFFVGVYELMPSLRRGVIAHGLAGFFVGFGVLWVYQLHLSFALLLPFLAAAFVSLARRQPREASRAAAWCAVGALVAGATLVPTLLRFGLAAVLRATGASVVFAGSNLLRLPEVIGRFLSFAAFEAPRFVGAGTEERLVFLVQHSWAAPFVVFATLCGIAQAIVLLAGFFRRAGPPDWPAIRTVTIVALVLVYVSFAFSVKGPSSHTFYVTLPVVMIYSFYCWERLLQRRWVRVLTACLLAAGLVTHVAIAIDKFGERSLYANRPLVARAIKERNYRLLGERRPEMWKTESEGR